MVQVHLDNYIIQPMKEKMMQLYFRLFIHSKLMHSIGLHLLEITKLSSTVS